MRYLLLWQLQSGSMVIFFMLKYGSDYRPFAVGRASWSLEAIWGGGGGGGGDYSGKEIDLH
jgi:hypothetical protein